MGYEEELKVMQDELSEALDETDKWETRPFDDRPDIERNRLWRSYNEKLKALKEKYNITD